MFLRLFGFCFCVVMSRFFVYVCGFGLLCVCFVLSMLCVVSVYVLL